MNLNLSKSNFVKGVQCPKMLWLAEHAEDEKVYNTYTYGSLKKMRPPQIGETFITL